MKKLSILLIAVLALASCTSNEEPTATDKPSSNTSSTFSTSSTKRSSSTKTADPSNTPLTTTQEPAAANSALPEANPQMAQPTVVECLQGTPGPARWSDGTVSFSQWCFDNRGGQQYLENESQAGLVENGECVGPAAECGYGTAANGARNPTSGEIQTYHGCQDGYINDPALCSQAEGAVRAADPNGSIY